MWNPTPNYKTYPWQASAVDAWEKAGCKGIIEAVTGSGKTLVGIEAINRLARRHNRLAILIVVPNEKLLYQWKNQIERSWIPKQKVALLGAGNTDDYRGMPLACVGIINSVVRRMDSLLSHTKSEKWKTLLIADEVHRYTEGVKWSQILSRGNFDYTMGLSATIEAFRIEGFGEIVYSYNFGNANSDGLIPPFDLIRTKVDLTPAERITYFELDELVSSAYRNLMDVYGDEISRIPEERFFSYLQKKMKVGARSAEEYDRVILYFLLAVYRRSAVTHLSHNKLDLAKKVTEHLVSRGKKTIVFFERTQSADQMAEQNITGEIDIDEKFVRSINDSGKIRLFIYHSNMSKRDRATSFARFSDSGPAALIACRSLDEGLDLPEVDAAVIASSTQSIRQRIQRIGRTLRRGSDGKRSVIVSLHVQGTCDMMSLQNDGEVFGSIARIHESRSSDVIKIIDKTIGLHNFPSITPALPEPPRPRVTTRRSAYVQNIALNSTVVQPPFTPGIQEK